MSGQDDLNQRLNELNSLLEVLEALLPSLIAHGLHIIATDPLLFKEQSVQCLFRLLPLESDDRALGLKILSWFLRNYPKGQGPGKQPLIPIPSLSFPRPAYSPSTHHKPTHAPSTHHRHAPSTSHHRHAPSTTHHRRIPTIRKHTPPTSHPKVRSPFPHPYRNFF